MTRCWAVVVAAGRGERSGLEGNKVFFPVAGRSVLSRSLDALAACGRIEGIVLVLAGRDFAAYEALVRREGAHPLVVRAVEGGDTRQQSAYNGLLAVPEDVKLVAIHDAARAMTPPDVVLQAIGSAERYGSGVAATAVTDTVKRVDGAGRAVETLNRESLRTVQTPQVFLRSLVLSAHERARAEGFEATDDAALVERYHGAVHLAVSDEGRKNVKLTTPADFEEVERLILPNLRVGQGFDAHRLAPGRALVLGGVTIEHEAGLDGHSDADAAAHALMDALLGAAGLGDIGRHFPDGDEAYLGISSMALLAEVAGKLDRAGFRAVNCDVTIVAQRPKLAPYMDQMKRNFARALGMAEGAVNVKATSTERMGYEGREEGISASAIALIAAT